MTRDIAVHLRNGFRVNHMFFECTAKEIYFINSTEYAPDVAVKDTIPNKHALHLDQLFNSLDPLRRFVFVVAEVPEIAVYLLWHQDTLNFMREN